MMVVRFAGNSIVLRLVQLRNAYDELAPIAVIESGRFTVSRLVQPSNV